MWGLMSKNTPTALFAFDSLKLNIPVRNCKLSWTNVKPPPISPQLAPGPKS